MKNSWFVYIKIDTNNRKVKSSGIKFNEFINGKDLSEFYTEDYKYVMEGKILKEFKGRKKYISNIPNYILEKIFDMRKSGVVIDFEKLSHDSVYI